MAKNGGARPGAGRKPGQPNRQSALRVAEAVRQGRRLPHEALMLIAENSLAMAARFQPERTQENGTKVANPEHNPGEYARPTDEQLKEVLAEVVKTYFEEALYFCLSSEGLVVIPDGSKTDVAAGDNRRLDSRDRDRERPGV